MILITGATSQLGEVIVNKLKENHEKIRCFVRETSKIDILKDENVEFAFGNFNDVKSIERALEDVDYVIHVGGIWYAKDILSILDLQNRVIKKLVFVGSTSKFQKVNSKDPKEIDLVTRMTAAEEIINKSKQNTIIIRPTMLYGIDKDKNILTLIKFMDRFHVFPIIGKGEGLKQPVHVFDVADAVLKTMYSEKLVKNEYNIPGAKSIEYKGIILSIKKNLKKPVIVLNIPLSLAKIGFKIYKSLNPKTIVNISMVNRVNKSFIFDFDSAKRDFDYTPMTFEEGVKIQIEYLREKGQIK